MSDNPDPFYEDRKKDGIKTVEAEGQEVPLVLRLQDIRKICKNTKEFSNDNPMLIVLHSEANDRDVRQLPIETDPPDHTDYRALVEPIYRKPKSPEFQTAMRAMVSKMVTTAVTGVEIEAVREFAVPLQCRALAMLLGLPESAAQTWIDWGVHIFRDS